MLKKLCVFVVMGFFSVTTFAQTKYQYQERIKLATLFENAIKDHAFPGGCIVAGSADKIFVKQCFGYNTYQKKVADNPDSLFDLASLTKVVATTTAIMLLYQQEKIGLDDKVIKYLPNFKGPTAAQTKLKSQITIGDLLTHTSGLPPDNNVYAMTQASVKERWQAVMQTPVVAYRHQYSIYSDMNFLLLGKIVEKVSHLPLNLFVQQNIFKLLDMNHTMYVPSKKFISQIVPTIYLPAEHYLLRGVVQDPIAQSLGGVAGNAGLFSTINDLARFGQMMLRYGKVNGKSLINEKTIRLFAKRADIVTGSSRALGWDTAYNPATILLPKDRAKFYGSGEEFYKNPEQFSAGLYIDPNANGHSGYTGTSFWISHKYGIFVVLLTNRVLPYVEANWTCAEKYWRQRINSAVWQNLGFDKENLIYHEPLPNSKQCDD